MIGYVNKSIPPRLVCSEEQMCWKHELYHPCSGDRVRFIPYTLLSGTACAMIVRLATQIGVTVCDVGDTCRSMPAAGDRGRNRVHWAPE